MAQTVENGQETKSRQVQDKVISFFTYNAIFKQCFYLAITKIFKNEQSNGFRENYSKFLRQDKNKTRQDIQDRICLIQLWRRVERD
jgi:hypothetical protein